MCQEPNELETCKFALHMLDAAEHRITIVLLATALLSLGQSIMVTIGEFFKGILCILGQSQSFKSTLVALFFCFTNNGFEMDSNFDSTVTAIVRAIGNKRDAVCMIDDCKPPSTHAMRDSLISKLERIIRLSSDNSGGYKRAGQHNSVVANKSECITCITAEEIPVQVYSTLARMLIIQMNRKSTTKEKMKHYREGHHVYREFIKNYILHISALGTDVYYSNLVNRFLQERDVLRDKLQSKDILVDNRTNDMCTWLYISFNEFLKYAIQVGALEQSQFAIYSQESEKVFLDLMIEQAERIGELDDITKFFSGLRYILDTNEVRLEELQARNVMYASLDNKATIGFVKKGYVYLRNDVTLKEVASHYKKFGKEFCTSESTLRRLLNDNGYIIPNTRSKSLIHRLNVNRINYQCIMFEEKIFKKLINGKDGEGNDEVPSDRIECGTADIFLGRGN